MTEAVPSTKAARATKAASRAKAVSGTKAAPATKARSRAAKAPAGPGGDAAAGSGPVLAGTVAATVDQAVVDGSVANGAHPTAPLNGGRRARTRSGSGPAAGANGKAAVAPGTLAPEKLAPAKPARATGPGRTAAPGTPAKTGAPVKAPAGGPAATVSTLRGPADALSRQVDVWDERVGAALSFLRRRLTGDYEVDEFGFDPELTRVLVHPLLRLMYQRYFRVEVSGVAYVPRDSAALLVANHSGTVPVDALMLSMAVHDETANRRHLRLLGADLVFRVPVLSEVARKGGATLACNPDAERLMRTNQLVGVFPEGFKGIGKRYSDRYKLQRFGRGGFVSAALRTGTPIIPVSIVGAEEIYPILGNLRPLARIVGLPYFPVTPLFPLLGPLGMLPLPSKWLIEFGAPIETSDYVDQAEDPIVVFNLADQVRETIQNTLHALLKRRPNPFG